MNITNFYDYAATLLTIIAVLVALTNIVVEVLKRATWNVIPTDLLAILVAMGLTLLAFFAWAAYAAIQVYWYYIAAAVLVGLMVAYAAMFGFDKLKEILNGFRNDPPKIEQ